MLERTRSHALPLASTIAGKGLVIASFTRRTRVIIALAAALAAGFLLAGVWQAAGVIGDLRAEITGARAVSAAGACEAAGLISVGDTGLCTHGPDPASFTDDASQPDFAAADLDPASALATCVGTGTDGRRVQVLYVHASNVVSRYAQFLPSFQLWSAQASQIYSTSAAQTGGSRFIRFVHDSGCVIQVADITVPASVTGDFTLLVNALSGQGYNSNLRKYLIFLDVNDPNVCGRGTVYPDDSASSANDNNSVRGYAVIYNGCWNSSRTIAHELTHNFGAVQSSAPHATTWSHCTDEWDVMCYNDGSGYQTRIVCPDNTNEGLLDCNKDDYFNTNPAPGSYLATHWNVANSGWLGGTGGPPPDPPPPNDDILTARDVGSLPYADEVSTLYATAGTDDPPHSNQDCWGSFQKTVWYRFTAPTDGNFVVDTANSTYDTMLGAYSGTPGNLTPLACNDDSGQNFYTSKLQFSAVDAGTVFYFVVGAYARGTTDGAPPAPGGYTRFNVTQIGDSKLTQTPTVSPTASPTPAPPPSNCIPTTPVLYTKGDTVATTDVVNLRWSCSTAPAPIGALPKSALLLVLDGPYTGGGLTWYRVQAAFGTGFVSAQYLAPSAGTPAPTSTPAYTPTPTATIDPNATATPTPSGPIESERTAASSNAVSAEAVLDGNSGTYWATRSSSPNPATAWFWIRFDGEQSVGQIHWVFARNGMADRWRIQYSTDGASWTTIVTRGNASTGVWQSYVLSSPVNARYIRFYFNNPFGDVRLGGIGEVKIYPPGPIEPSPTPTQTPTPSATPVIVGYPVGAKVRVVDGPLNLRKSASLSGTIIIALPTGTTGTITGATRTGSGLTWVPIRTSYGTGWVVGTYIQVTSLPSSSEAGIPAKTPIPTATATIPATTTVEPTVTPAFTPDAATATSTTSASPAATEPPLETPVPSPAVTSTPALETPPPTTTTILATETPTALPPIDTATATPELAATPTEISTGASPEPVETEPPPTATLAPAGTEPAPYVVTRTFRTANSGSGAAAVDGDPTTIWQTDGSSPPRSATLVLDLGEELPIGTVRLLTGPDGLHGVVRIDVSTDRRTWTNIANPDAVEAGDWTAIDMGGVSARYVRLFFANPDGLPVAGGIAEVEVLP